MLFTIPGENNGITILKEVQDWDSFCSIRIPCMNKIYSIIQTTKEWISASGALKMYAYFVSKPNRMENSTIKNKSIINTWLFFL